MPLYTKKEFADICGQKTKHISTYVDRGKIMLDINGNINTTDAINASFMAKNIPGARATPMRNIVKVKPSAEFDEMFVGDTPGEGLTLAQMLESKDIKNLTYPELEKIYKYRQGEQLKRNTEKIDLEIAKKRGEVIPSDLLPPVIVQHNQAFITSYRNVSDQILNDYTQIKDFDVNEIAEMRTRLLEAINTGASDALVMSLKSIENIVKDYTEKRGAGQRL